MATSLIFVRVNLIFVSLSDYAARIMPVDPKNSTGLRQINIDTGNCWQACILKPKHSTAIERFVPVLFPKRVPIAHAQFETLGVGPIGESSKVILSMCSSSTTIYGQCSSWLKEVY